MIFKIVRHLIPVILLALCLIPIKKGKIKRKKLAYILSIVFCLAVEILIVLFPIENLFITFKTPQQAFEYSMFGKIQSIDYGKNSCFIIYMENKGAYSTCIIPKSGEGYKLPNKLQIQNAHYNLKRYGDIRIYNYKGIDDYYLFGEDKISSETNFEKDSCQSEIKYIVDSNNNSDKKTIIAHFYIKDYSDPYYVYISGERTRLLRGKK